MASFSAVESFFANTLADDLALKHIERREQRRDAVTLVVVGDGAGTSLLHRQPRLGAVQRLDLAFLIDRENDGVVGRIEHTRRVMRE